VSSKSSKLLAECIIGFAKDFQVKHNKELKDYCTEKEKNEDSYDLIEKYFSNFPYKMITSKNQILFLSGELKKVPLEFDEKFKMIFPVEKDYNFIRSEIPKLPISIPSEFLSLYEDLKLEMEQIKIEASKSLDKKLDN